MLDISKLEKVKVLSGGQINARCPACASEGHDKTGNHLSVLSDGRFNCIKYSNDKSHNKLILQLTGSNRDNENFEEIIEQELLINNPKTWPIEALDSLVKDYSYWNKRGISDQTCSFFKIGVATKGQLFKRSVIPIINRQNAKQIIGFTGRALDPKITPKYKHISDSKQKWLLPAIDKEIADANSVILVESPGCFLSLFEHGIKNTVCLFGLNLTTGISSYLIKQNPKRILIATNNEPSNDGIGNKAANKIAQQLSSFFDKERLEIQLPYKKDFNEMSTEEIEKYKEENKL